MKAGRSQDRPVILIVDDDPDILEAVSEILEAEGYEVRRAKNGQEALDRLAGTQLPHLVLLDLMMPVMDGREFAKRMRERKDADRIPIVVVSADRAVNLKSEDIGAAAYLAKPFELTELLEVVRATLAGS